MSGLFGTVFGKELRDSLRDHRSIMGALIMPVVGPLMFAMMFTFIAKQHGDDRPVELAVVGADRAPNLISYLEQNEVVIEPAPDDYEEQVRTGDLDAVLVIPEDYPEKIRSGEVATLNLVVDESRDSARSTVRRARQKLVGFSQSLGVLRLLARGVSPDLARPVTVAAVDLSTPQKLGAKLLSMIPMFAFLAAFMGGMNVAIDATAGERERGSLEPLLINPAPRMAVVVGKWLVVVAFNLGVTFLTLVFFKVAMDRVPLEQLSGSFQFGVVQILGSLALVIPVAMFAAALLMTVSLMAKSFKEAQTYLSILIFLPMLPSLALMINPVKTQLWMMLVPTLGQNILVNDLMRGEALNPLHVVVASLTCIVAAAVVLSLAARLMQHERVVFGR